MEILHEQVKEVEKNVQEQHIANEVKANEKKIVIQGLEEELKIKKNESDKLLNKLMETRCASTKLLKSIKNVYEVLRSENNAVLELLGIRKKPFII